MIMSWYRKQHVFHWNYARIFRWDTENKKIYLNPRFVTKHLSRKHPQGLLEHKTYYFFSFFFCHRSSFYFFIVKRCMAECNEWIKHVNVKRDSMELCVTLCYNRILCLCWEQKWILNLVDFEVSKTFSCSSKKLTGCVLASR